MKFGKTVKTFTSEKGNRVFFRYPKKDDFKAVWSFACNLASEDTFIELSGTPPTEEEEQKWFREAFEKMEKKESMYIYVFVDGVFAGNGRVEKGKYRHSHVGNIGLSIAPAYREEGIGTKLM